MVEFLISVDFESTTHLTPALSPSTLSLCFCNVAILCTVRILPNLQVAASRQWYFPHQNATLRAEQWATIVVSR